MMDSDGEAVDSIMTTTTTTIYKIDACSAAPDFLFADMDSVNVHMAIQEDTEDAVEIGAGQPTDHVQSLIH